MRHILYHSCSRLWLWICMSLGVFSASPSLAHPHVWVTGEASFEFDQQALVKVGMRWQFDAFFSQVLGADFDTNSDGSFDDAETLAMENQVFTSLKDFGYFTHLRTDGAQTEQTFDRVENFVISSDAGELIFEFDLILSNPINPITAPIGLSLYDPTIYVDIILDGDTPVTLVGADGLGCALEYRQGDEVQSQSYFMVPQEVWLSCSGS
ncbi:MAG: DUF1007 family protein [Rhodospirillaceae bacterium]